jgi:chromosome segregation ATPase
MDRHRLQEAIPMKRKMVWVLVATIVLAVPLLAQSGGPDTLSALLVEVRQLRIAMERAATVTPQIQLLGSRLSVQNERLARAGHDHDTARQELDDVSAALAQIAARIPELETRAAQESNPVQQRQFVQEHAAAREQASDLAAREQRLRARENELAAVLGAEETQWAELNRRVDEVERSLGARQPR